MKGMMKFQSMDYLLKPVDREELGKILWNAEEILRKRGVESPDMGKSGDTEVTGVSRYKMQRAVDYIRQN